MNPTYPAGGESVPEDIIFELLRPVIWRMSKSQLGDQGGGGEEELHTGHAGPEVE